MLRLAAALLLGPLLSGETLARGYGVYADPWVLLFPYFGLYLFLDRAARRGALNDVQAFLLGSGFSFLYNGLYAKAMHEGGATTGLAWLAVLAGPLEWGMFCVLWLHLLAAGRRRGEGEPGLAGRAALVAIAAAAGAVYVGKTLGGHYQAQRALGLEWIVADLILLALAWTVWRGYRASLATEAPTAPPAWVWLVAGVGLWMSGASALGRFGAWLGLPQPAYFSMQAAWLAALGVTGWNLWRGRFEAAPSRRHPLVLAAGALRAVGVVVLLYWTGPEDVNLARFWPDLLCELPARLLFYYAFFTSRLEV